MNNVTPRGCFVLGILATLALWGLVLVSSSLWWVGFSSPEAEFLGWCWGSMAECVELQRRTIGHRFGSVPGGLQLNAAEGESERMRMGYEPDWNEPDFYEEEGEIVEEFDTLEEKEGEND